ncbi:MAG: ABC transporter permease [bacterium]|nr:ABC transporter permease [bacterium]
MFYFRNIKESLQYHKVINLIVVLTLAIGMLYPLGMATIIKEIIDDRDLCRYENADQHMIIDYFDALVPLDEYREQMSWLEENGLQYGSITYYSTTVYVDGSFQMAGFSSYTDTYLEQEGYRLVEGRLLTEEEQEQGAPYCVCMWGGERRIGDIINVMGHELEVVGIVQCPMMYGGTMVSQNWLYRVLGSSLIQYRLSIYAPDGFGEITQSGIRRNLWLGEIRDVTQGEEIYAEYYESIDKQVGKRLYSSLMVLLPAICSMVAILFGKVMEQKYQIGLRMALGASKAQTVLEIFLENFFLFIAAFVVDMVLFIPVKRISTLIRIYPGVMLTVLFLLSGAAVTALISIATVTALVGKKQVCEILKES